MPKQVFYILSQALMRLWNHAKVGKVRCCHLPVLICKSEARWCCSLTHRLHLKLTYYRLWVMVLRHIQYCVSCEQIQVMSPLRLLLNVTLRPVVTAEAPCCIGCTLYPPQVSCDRLSPKKTCMSTRSKNSIAPYVDKTPMRTSVCLSWASVGRQGWQKWRSDSKSRCFKKGPLGGPWNEGKGVDMSW